jgi:hypothetical protein
VDWVHLALDRHHWEGSRECGDESLGSGTTESVRLTPHVDEITGSHHCGFQHNRSMADQVFSIWQILEKKWEYNGTVHQLLTDFKKAYNVQQQQLNSLPDRLIV